MKFTKRFWSKSLVIAAILVCFIMAFSLLLPIGSQFTVYAADTDVSNGASFSTDVIYQIVTDRFYDGDPSNNPTGAIYDKNDPDKYHGGDWAGITQKLNANYFTDMGITALWISPPVENIASIDPSNGNAAYHGYWAKDFFRTNQFFGTKAELQTLINTAHAKNIKVVIDFVPNHTSSAENGQIVFPEDGRFYRDGVLMGGLTNDTKGYFNHLQHTDFSDWEQGIYRSLFGLADLNQQNSTIDKYLKDAIKVWTDMGVDGIRVDAVKHMSMGWQTNWLSDLYSHKPTFVFGEWSGGIEPNAEMEAFANNSGMSLLDFRYAEAVRAAVGKLTIGMNDFHNIMVGTSIDYKEVNDQVTFIDNHDMERFMYLTNQTKASVDTAYVLQLTSRGIPNIYYGSEQYLNGATDPDNRRDMPGFGRTNAYNIISKLAPLRKSNPALAYGTTRERWINSDVYVYERQFGNSVVLTAVNRNSAMGYDITGALTNLPTGNYPDVLQNLKGGGTLTVSNGAIGNYWLGAGQCAVWQYTAPSESRPIIGNVDPMIGIAGNTITITGRGFGSSVGTVKFGTANATVVSWSDSLIKVKVPSVSAGKYNITVGRAGGTTSASYNGFNVLSGVQTSVRFKVNNASTYYGQNVYIVGNIPELGSWDTSKAVGRMFCNTPTIGIHPTWFYDINVPVNTRIEYKFIKVAPDGSVIWESGSNHVYTTGSTTSEVSVNWQTY